jgi:hypothetical protein
MQKRIGGVGQVVEHLVSQHEAQSSNPSTAKNNVVMLCPLLGLKVPVQSWLPGCMFT